MLVDMLRISLRAVLPHRAPPVLDAGAQCRRRAVKVLVGLPFAR
jgi:hypothetical protein